MNTKDKQILDALDTIETGEPDISTERLIAMAADMCGVDYSRVVDAMHRQHSNKPKGDKS